MTRYFVPRNWAMHQHYKSRKPKWIKLHNALLRDYEFTGLTELQQCHLVKLWLLYAEVGRALQWDCTWIARQLGSDSRAISRSLNALLSSNFIELTGETASTTIAPRKQDASLELETEREKEQTPSESSASDAARPPPDLKSQIFGPCLRWLADKAGKPERTLRSQVGRWCSRWGDGVTLEAMMAAQRASPVEPVAYIERMLKSGGPQGGKHSQARQAAAEDEADRMVEEAAREADRRNDQHLRADHEATGAAEPGDGAAAAEGNQRPAKSQVRRGGGGLRRMSSALPAVGVGGGGEAGAGESPLLEVAEAGGTAGVVHSGAEGDEAAIGATDGAPEAGGQATPKPGGPGAYRPAASGAGGVPANGQLGHAGAVQGGGAAQVGPEDFQPLPSFLDRRNRA